MNEMLFFLIRHFPDLLDLNLTVTIVILFVMSVRVMMKGAPKIFSYALWWIVLLRLLVPVSIESPVSFVPERTEFSSMVDLNQELPEIRYEIISDREQNQQEREHAVQGQVTALSYSVVDPQTYLTIGWLGGMTVLLLWGAISWFRLRCKLRVVIPAGKNIYLADDIGAPFVMGFFRPRIYLPSALTPREQDYILMHEQHHIRRGDHIIKWLFWLALCIHWFNPFVWAAFILAGRDMEMSCDEAVIRHLESGVRAEYSATLLTLATGRRIIAGVPLAFGEGDPKGRIRNISRWKKPALWVLMLCVTLCVGLGICLLTDPETPEPEKVADFRDLDAASVISVTLHNGHNGQFTHLMDSVAAQEICDILKSVYGTNGSSSKGYYGWTYSVTLHHRDGLETTVAFGDTDVFLYGMGEDGYAIQYEMEGLTKDGIVRLLSRYDESGFDWNAASTAKRWGVSLFPEEVTASGVKVTFGLDTSVLSVDYLEHNQLHFGEYYEIEQWVDREWVPLARVAEEIPGPAAVERLTPITADSTGQLRLDWTDTYGILPQGEYRIEMRISCQKKGKMPEILPIYGEFTISGESADHGISIAVHDVSADHVILTFHQEKPDGKTYARQNGYTLEKLENGVWEYIDMGMDWGNTQVSIDFDISSQSGNGLYLSFEHCGPLEPGRYRVGQTIFCGMEESFTVHTEFMLDGTEGTVPPSLQQLPQWYSLEQAQIDGCVVFHDGMKPVNEEQFSAFVQESSQGRDAWVRCGTRVEEGLQFYDLCFDGQRYTITFLEEGREVEKKYPYLLRYAGEAEGEAYDAYEVYVLTNEQDLWWDVVRPGAFAFRHSSGASWHVVYSRIEVYPDYMHFPESRGLTLFYKGQPLLTVEDRSAIEAVRAMFSEAPALGYTPKTYYLGPEITFLGIDGSEKTVILDVYSDMFLCDGGFYQFADPDRDDTSILLNYLGLDRWPEEVIIP